MHFKDEKNKKTFVFDCYETENYWVYYSTAKTSFYTKACFSCIV